MPEIAPGPVSLFTAAWTTDAELRFTSCAGNAPAAHGLQAGDFVGKTLPQILPNGEKDPPFAVHRRALAGETVTYEDEWQGRVYRARVEPVRDGEGRIVGVSGVAVDVTREKTVEDAIGASERRYRLLFEGSPLPMWVFDSDTLAFKAVNDAVIRHYGYTREEFLSMTLRDVRFPEDVPTLERAVATVRLRGWPSEIGYVGRWRHRKKDGSIIFVDVHSAPMPVDGGEGFIAILHDVTERLRIEEEIQRAREDLERSVEERTRELRESEERWRSLVENAPDVISTLDRAGTILSVNRTVSGGPPEQVVGTSAYRWISERHHDILRRSLENVFRTGLPDSYELEAAGKEGTLRWYSTRISPLFKDGGVVGATAITTDVTDRKRMEEDLRFQKTLLECQGEASVDGVLTVSPDGRMVSFNRRFVEMWGVPDEIMRNGFDDAALDYAVGLLQDPEGFLARVRYLYDHPEESSRDEIVFKDGRVFERHSAPVRGRDGTHYGRVWFFRDITEQKRAEERLRRLAEEQGLLLAHTRDFVYRHDVRGVFNYLSPAVEAVTGHPAQEWLAHYTRFLTDNPINRKVVEYTERTLRTGEQSPPYFVEVRHRDGRPILLEVSERAYTEGGAIAGIVGVARDVTEREQAQEQVRQAADATRRAYEALKRTQNRLIEAEKLASVGMVMAGVAHEINNPLNVMYGNLRLLQDEWRKGDPSDRSRISRMLGDAMKAAENAKVVVEEFRHFARDPSAAEPADLRECVQEAIEHARPLCGKRVRIVRKLGRVPPIRLYRGQIRRAVQNMLKNAVEAIEGRGVVTVTVARRGRSAVVEVEDTGRGIAKENLARLFEPFFTTKEPGRGFGLGLAMCAAVAQKHGGRISVKSRPGHGARFTLTLPLAK